MRFNHPMHLLPILQLRLWVERFFSKKGYKEKPPEPLVWGLEFLKIVTLIILTREPSINKRAVTHHLEGRSREKFQLNAPESACREQHDAPYKSG
jgi:hypothetical protein